MQDLPPMTEIANASGNRLFRIDNGGVHAGDFYIKFADGSGQYVDTSYTRADEERLLADFKDDFNG